MLSPDARNGPSPFRRPWFWALFTLAALAAVVFAARFFTAAFPVVGLELAMDREAALEAASDRALERGWGPDGFRQAGSFREADPEVRTYLELALGVEDAFEHLVREADYHPYAWRIRHFREEERTEVSVRFTPAGDPYGFTLELPEDEPGAALAPEEARALAEEGAGEWGVALDRYTLVESAQETRPAGRVDHTFVYRRDGAELGDAEARLGLEVAGDELAEVRPFVRVPEAFSREYQELRSANETVALVATLGFLLLFGLVGCGGGVFYLLRRDALVWKPALVWGFVVAGLSGLAILNALPLAWMGYDTAVPRELFLVQQWGAAAAALFLGGAVLAVIFMAAEGLTRRSRPGEPRLWKLWSPGVAGTGDVVGRTVAGYLLAAIQVGFVVGFYYLATRRPGWWMPSETLVQPDLIATHLPWLSAVSSALLAGFWEESLFRAVPIAGALLLAHRFGARGLLVGMAIVVQAVVFAAAHAAYPQQPAYARVVELLVPATVWGLVYLRFGLLPVILAHALYNLTWFSLPIVAAPAALWMDRTALAVAALLPLGIVGYRAVRDGYRDRVPGEGLNRSLATIPREAPAAEPEGAPEAAPEPTPESARPGPAAPGAQDPREGVGDAVGATSRLRGAVAAAGVLGLLLWLAFTPFRADVPTVEVSADEAGERARGELADRGVALAEPWQALPRVQATPGPAHHFVWRDGGPEAYDALLDAGHLQGPHWQVRFARFVGTTEERAEEFRMGVDGRGEVRRYRHILPEEREGAELTEDEARDRVHEELRATFGLDPAAVEEVSAESSRLPGRLDWTFTFSRPGVHPMEAGDARAEVRVAGDAVVDGRLFVHVPEEWEREERARETRRALLALPGGLALVGLLGGAAVAGLVRWARGGAFRPRPFRVVGGLLLATAAVQAWNGWPRQVAGFGTARPFRDQAFAAVSGEAAVALFAALAGGLAAGFVHGWWRSFGTAAGRERWGAPSPRALLRLAGWGAALGLALAGAAAFLGGVLGVPEPTWLGYGPAGTRWPALSAVGMVTPVVFRTLFLLVLLVALHRVTGGGRRRWWTIAFLALVGGLGASGGLAGAGVAAWTGSVLAGAVGVLLLLRVTRELSMGVVPVLVVVATLLPVLRDGVAGAYPGSVLAAVLALALLGALGLAWAAALAREDGGAPDRLPARPAGAVGEPAGAPADPLRRY